MKMEGIHCDNCPNGKNKTEKEMATTSCDGIFNKIDCFQEFLYDKKLIYVPNGSTRIAITEAIIEEAKKHPEIENLYGAIHAVAGITKDDFIDLLKLSPDTLELVAASPSSAIGTIRDKPEPDDCARIFEVFEKRNIRYFFYIGGNDSAGAAHIINTTAAKAGYEIRAFHVPKTVDNDLLMAMIGMVVILLSCLLMNGVGGIGN